MGGGLDRQPSVAVVQSRLERHTSHTHHTTIVAQTNTFISQAESILVARHAMKSPDKAPGSLD